MPRLARLFAALLAVPALSGCLAVQTVGVAAGAAGATLSVAGDVAEGAVKVVTPGRGGDEDEADGGRGDGA